MITAMTIIITTICLIEGWPIDPLVLSVFSIFSICECIYLWDNRKYL